MIRTVLLINIILILNQGCLDLEEQDISKNQVKVVTPEDSTIVSYSQVYFNWNEIEGARNYQLQVVRPNFSNIQQMVYDTLLTQNDVILFLSPGNYQWRIRALNNSYSTEYFTRYITVHNSGSIVNETVLLQSPTNNQNLAASNINFSWLNLNTADFYRLTIKRNNWDNGTIVLDSLVTSSPISLGSFSEGLYFWGVRAESSNEMSNYSTHSFILDYTIPQVPILVAPADAAQLTDSPVLQWQYLQDSGSPVSDSVFVYNSPMLNQSILLGVSNNGIYGIEQLDPGVYYWRVKRIDAAGNSSGFSFVRSFEIQ